MTALLPEVRTQVLLALRNVGTGGPDGVHGAHDAGRSLEFHDLRDYVRGDDTSDIDWRASARRGSLLVRRHVAERRTTLMLAIATGRSMAGMASPGRTKAEVVTEVAGALASIALHQGDHVGSVMWRDAAPTATRPSTRPLQTERMLTTLAAANSGHSSESDLCQVLDLAGRSLRRRGVVAVVCGDVPPTPALVTSLRRLTAQHRVMLVCVPDLDPTSATGRRVVGLGNGRRLPFLDDADLGRAWRQDCADRAAARAATLSSLSINHLEVDAGQPVVPQILRLAAEVARARR